MFCLYHLGQLQVFIWDHHVDFTHIFLPVFGLQRQKFEMEYGNYQPGHINCEYLCSLYIIEVGKSLR